MTKRQPLSHTSTHVWEWKILVLLKNKKISSRGPLSWRNSMFVSCMFKRRWRLSWRNSMFVSCVFKRRWQLGGRKCCKMPESDICLCRKAKVVELHIVCMLEQSYKKKKKKKNLILKVWFYGNSVKLRQSPTHEHSNRPVTVRDLERKSLKTGSESCRQAEVLSCLRKFWRKNRQKRDITGDLNEKGNRHFTWRGQNNLC